MGNWNLLMKELLKFLAILLREIAKGLNILQFIVLKIDKEQQKTFNGY